jgi:hypothetical protein
MQRVRMSKVAAVDRRTRAANITSHLREINTVRNRLAMTPNTTTLPKDDLPPYGQKEGKTEESNAPACTGHPERGDNRVRGADAGKRKLLSQVGDKN